MVGGGEEHGGRREERKVDGEVAGKPEKGLLQGLKPT